jgi:DNA invertase Pin-like site-specific DNA recombinase
MTTRRKGVSYSRFSDPKQAKGDSEDRQDRDFRRFCDRHKLSPSQEHAGLFVDRGLSGYKDEHRKKGKLGVLIALAKDGQFEPGTVIVVEAWDRLGRLRPDRQTDLIAELLRTGVSIGICRLDDIFTEEDFGTHKWTTLAVFIQMAYQESKQKAERVAASWEKRRLRARLENKPMTSCGPAWVEYVNGKFQLIPERAAVVKRIFQLAATGYGQTRIVKMLTRDKVPAFGERRVRDGRKRSQFSGNWTGPYINLILNDRRALGEHRPCDAKQKPIGEVLHGYYPTVVTEQEFLAARVGANKRNNKKGPRQRKYLNLFSGLLRHAKDGEGFSLQNKGTAVNPHLLLVNTEGASGRGLFITFPYPIFEEAILKLLREIDPKEIIPSKQPEKPARVEVLRVQLANVREQIKQLTEDLRQGYSAAVSAVLREQEAVEARLKDELEEEKAKAASVPEKDWSQFKDLAETLATAKDQDDARLRLRAILRRMVDSVWLLIVARGRVRLCAAQVWFKDGIIRHRGYLLYCRVAAHRSAGGWRTRSLATVAEAGDIDLRKRPDAKWLEKELATIDLAALWAASLD